jgi:glycosyltransferase involved in cell wall biosynthesis
MRILQVIAALAPRYGGPAVAGPELSRELARQGHQLSIFTSDADGSGHLKVPLGRPIRDHGVDVHYFHGTEIGKYVFSPGMWRALKYKVAEFDVVHIWSVYGFSTTAAAYWCRKRQVPHLVFPHGSLDPFLRRRNRPRKWIYSKLFAERDYRRADAVMFNTQEEMRLASDWPGLRAGNRNGAHAQKRVIVPIGIAPEWFAPADPVAGEQFRRKFPSLAGKRLIVYFGRINFKKGLDILAHAFANVAQNRDDLHLVIAGPDNEGYGSNVRRWLAEKNALTKATFTGLLEGEDRYTILREAEIFALTSFTENFGQSAAESMASGVPVVISDQVNIWPEVQGAGAGLVVPCDVQAATHALQTLIEDRARAQEMGQRGKQWAAEHLPWSVVGRQMVEAYEEIIRHHSGSFQASAPVPLIQ